jgi:hypothetical protein
MKQSRQVERTIKHELDVYGYTTMLLLLAKVVKHLKKLFFVILPSDVFKFNLYFFLQLFNSYREFCSIKA